MCLRVWASGKVQGVGYRAFARKTAIRQRISGYAHNLPDGRVELLLCGPADALDAVLLHLRDGPRWSRVDQLQRESAECCGTPGFTTG